MAKLPSGTLVVDASLLIGIATRDRHATPFTSVLARSVATSLNFGEVIYKLHQKAGSAPAQTEQAFCSALRLQVDAVDLAVVRHFANLKKIDTASRRAQQVAGVTQIKSLSLADMTCLAYGLEANLPILTGDAHWCTLKPHGLAVDVYDFRDGRLTI